ncbi:MAG: hypothetical protein K0R69_710 [Clostridia bacterium]|jgi:ubiquinone/menaquinone biosynthesis C-methylase UbiE|nr:hypothetical protein [Clostridia bacterium]
MNNSANIKKYRTLAPLYDLFFGRIFKTSREKAFKLLQIEPGSSVLLVGVGTGEDLAFIPEGCKVVGIDLSDEMLKAAKRKAAKNDVTLLQMNAEKLDLASNTYDFVILNLILSVAENPEQVISETVRVVKETGNILVFDKFVKQGEKITFFKEILNKVTSAIGTDITRCFEAMIVEMPLKIKREQASLFKGNYRMIILCKK